MGFLLRMVHNVKSPSPAWKYMHFNYCTLLSCGVDHSHHAFHFHMNNDNKTLYQSLDCRQRLQGLCYLTCKSLCKYVQTIMNKSSKSVFALL